jgi:hypothetical protein
MARRSVFISYAHADRPRVEESAALLRAGGVTIFIDVVDIDYGERWMDVLKRALDKCERVMVFWSVAAKASDWVEKEWRYALTLGKKIVPTLLDQTPLPEELCAFQALKRFSTSSAAAPPDPNSRPTPVAPSPAPVPPAASKAGGPTFMLTAIAAAIVMIFVGVSLWSVLGQRRGLTAPVQSASAPAVPASAVAPRRPNPASLKPTSFDEAFLSLMKAGEIASDPSRTANTIDAATNALRGAFINRDAIHDYDELRALILVADDAERSLNETLRRVEQGQAQASPAELRAFSELRAELAGVAASLRMAGILSRPPMGPPGPAKAPVPPEPGLELSLVEERWMLGVGALLLTLGGGYWIRRRLRAAAFVKAVFST